LTSTDDNRACFLASTPLQLICCSEAREHYKITHPLLIMVKPDNKPTVDQMKRLADRLDWKDDQIIWMKKNTYYLRLPFVIRHLKTIPFDYIFSGYLGSPAQEAIYSNINSELICVDDGMATIFLVERFRKYGFTTSIKKKKRTLLKFLGVNVPENQTREELHFYTFFGLEPDNKVSIEINNLSLLRRLFTHEHKEQGKEAVGFIGQPFREENAYIDLSERIKRLIAAHPNKQLVYFPHRKEDIKQLKVAFSGLDIEIFSAEWPIEIEIAKSPLNFTFLYSYISTALFTIKKLSPNTNIYQVNSNLDFTKREFYDMAQKVLINEGIDEIEI